MAKDFEMGYLLDFYGEVLTPKQREMLNQYYNDDLSLSEIGENFGITRQGARDAIKHGETTLKELEAKVGFAGRYRRVQEKLEELEQLYQETTGQTLPRFYRPPQGKYSEENLRQAQALGYRTVFWSLAYVDWNTDAQPSAEEAYAKLLPRIHDGAIVLLHSTSATNAAILDDLLTKWEEMGYTFAPLTELPGLA